MLLDLYNLLGKKKRKRVDNNSIKAYKAVYEDPDVDFEAELQLGDPEEKYFLPNERSRHRMMENDDDPKEEKELMLEQHLKTRMTFHNQSCHKMTMLSTLLKNRLIYKHNHYK